MKRAFAVGAAIAALAVAAGARAAQVDYFLKIPGVEGEARDGAHDKWIIIKSIEWGGYRLDAEAGAVRFGDGAHGRRLPSGSSSSPASGDPDRPVIVGSVPNSGMPAQQNASDLAFVISRAGKATAKLMKYCADGKHLAKVEIDQLSNRETVARYVLHNPRFVSFTAGEVRIAAVSGAARSEARAAQNQVALAARALETDPTIRLTYDCADWTNYQTGEAGGNCAASKASKDVKLKGSKILEN